MAKTVNIDLNNSVVYVGDHSVQFPQNTQVLVGYYTDDQVSEIINGIKSTQVEDIARKKRIDYQTHTFFKGEYIFIPKADGRFLSLEMLATIPNSNRIKEQDINFHLPKVDDLAKYVKFHGDDLDKTHQSFKDLNLESFLVRELDNHDDVILFGARSQKIGFELSLGKQYDITLRC